MAYSFQTSSGRKAFRQFNEPLYASDYINNKKAKASYCFANNCKPSIKVGSQSNKLLFDLSNKLTMYPCKNVINKSNLYINLITKLDLQDVPVIADFSGNITPTPISKTANANLNYNIDPSGKLFGNTICGVNNYVNYMVYTLSGNGNVVVPVENSSKTQYMSNL